MMPSRLPARSRSVIRSNPPAQTELSGVADELTTYDVRILEQLQRNAEQSTAELADKVGLSQSPCWRRLQRLKEDGYIRSQVALLDRRKLGHELVIFSTFKMQTLSEEKRAEFLRKIEGIPEIIECHTIFGEMDILVKVIAPSMSWYQAFIFNTLMKLPGVTDIRSTVTLAEVKYTTQVPVRIRPGT
jgi:Lrp/AsnC family transcriptional regulator